MPTSYWDQFFTIDPGNPPAAGTPLAKSWLEAVDENDNGLLNRFSNDSVDGQDITASWPGDTITVVMNGATVTITGATFYLADGRAVFTPTDGTNLDDATFVSSTYVTSQGSVPVGNLGPPCFVEGTAIRTPGGERAIEGLKAGDLVETVDNGAQPVLWVGCSVVSGRGDNAPVVFRPGAIGNAEELRVSPQHRILVTGWRAELHFGEDAVLVPAKHLVNGADIVREEVEEVDYWHLMFDNHEVVWSGGVPTESFYPGDQILLQNPKARAEILALKPEMAGDNVVSLPRTARSTVKRAEATVLHAA